MHVTDIDHELLYRLLHPKNREFFRTIDTAGLKRITASKAALADLKARNARVRNLAARLPVKIRIFEGVEGVSCLLLSYSQLISEFPDDVDVRGIEREIFWCRRVCTEHFIYYLDYGRMKPFQGYGNGSGENDASDKDQLFEYLDVCEFANQVKAVTMKNAITDIIKGRKTCSDGYFSPQLAKRVYDVTKQGDGLRRLLADTYAYRATRWSQETLDWSTDKHRGHGNHGLLADHSAIVAKNKRFGELPGYPNSRPDSYYHDSRATVTAKSGTGATVLPVSNHACNRSTEQRMDERAGPSQCEQDASA